jgi:predicted MFS family arabinose efflux permease
MAHEYLLRIILMVAVVGIFGSNFNVLVPVFAKEVLKQQETGFGFLMSFVGLGAFTGAMLIATMSKSGPQRFILNIVPLFLATLLILTGLTDIYLLTGLGLAASGLCFVTFIASANSSLQLNASDEYRGRVISLYTLVFGGSVPLGSLYSGIISDHFGPRAGFIACGGVIFILMGLRHLFGRQSRKYSS